MTSISKWRYAIYLSLATAGPVLGQAITVTTDSLVFRLADRPLGEPHLAIHPRNERHLLGAAMVHDPLANLADSTRAKIRCATFVSVDDGATWQSHLFDIAACFDPWVTITPDGHALFTALGRDPKLPQRGDLLIAYHSPDGGQTWDAQPVSLGPGHDHPMTVVDRGDSTRANWLYVVSSLDARADNGVLRFGLRYRDRETVGEPSIRRCSCARTISWLRLRLQRFYRTARCCLLRRTSAWGRTDSHVAASSLALDISRRRLRVRTPHVHQRGLWLRHEWIFPLGARG
jgi:hypothetical protein